jgi:hypothetical protein
MPLVCEAAAITDTLRFLPRVLEIENEFHEGLPAQALNNNARSL